MQNETQAEVDAQRAELVSAFGVDADPLAEYESNFQQTDVDPFGLFQSEVLSTRDISPRTLDGYDRVFRQWKEYMADQGRHPACPNENHVKGFARHELHEKDNHPDTVSEKLRKLNDVYTYWAAERVFPHPNDFNPVALAKEKVNLDADEPAKEPPRIPVHELREMLEGVNNVRDRAVIVLQLKLGVRATELANMELQDVHIAASDLQDHYESLGSHHLLDGRENAIAVPDDREGNKSQRPRVLPLDDETRRVLLRYLLIRPDIEGPWLFLSESRHEQFTKQAVNQIWKRHFHPEYAETEQHRAVTSHFGRHRFTTYWRVEEDLNRELIKYMRGDTAGSARIDDRGAIDEYIHTYYEDIEPVYRERIYKLGV